MKPQSSDTWRVSTRGSAGGVLGSEDAGVSARCLRPVSPRRTPTPIREEAVAQGGSVKRNFPLPQSLFTTKTLSRGTVQLYHYVLLLICSYVMHRYCMHAPIIHALQNTVKKKGRVFWVASSQGRWWCSPTCGSSTLHHPAPIAAQHSSPEKL